MSAMREVGTGLMAGFMGYVVIVGAISVFNGISTATTGKSLTGYISDIVPSINFLGA